jgi:hypothetical protein
MRRSPWRLLAALLVSLLAGACADLPTTENDPAGEMAQLGFALDLSSTSVSSVSVQVTAADISQTLVYNIPVTNGTASGRIDVPPGTARTITVRAYDARGTQTHEGSTTVDVRPGNNPAVTVTLIPRPGEVPIAVNFGSVVIYVMSRGWPDMPAGYSIGRMVGFEAQVTTADGTPIPDAVVRWASLDPTVMDVTQDGTGYALSRGTTQVVATWNGYGAAVEVTVAGPADYATPELNGLSFDAATVRNSGPPQQVTLNVYTTDAVSGVDSVEADIRSGSGAGWTCIGAPTATAGLWQCTVTVDGSTAPGEYTVKSLALIDAVGNGVGWAEAGLASAGFTAKFTVAP